MKWLLILLVHFVLRESLPLARRQLMVYSRQSSINCNVVISSQKSISYYYKRADPLLLRSSKPTEAPSISVMKNKRGGADKEQPASSAAGVLIPCAEYLRAVGKYILRSQLPMVSN